MVECMKTAAKVQQEENPMDKMTTELMECFCDKHCKYPCDKSLTQEQVEDKCCECEAGQIVIHMLNEYNRINDFDNSQSKKMLVRIAELEQKVLRLEKLKRKPAIINQDFENAVQEMIKND